MINAGNLNLLGSFLKTHGIDGHLMLKLFFLPENELEKGEPVFIEIDGIPVPFFISSFRFLSDDAAIVRVDDINNSREASQYVNCNVYTGKDKPLEGPVNNSDRIAKLIGCLIVDEKMGESGILVDIFELPENPVMKIDYEGKELLVPFNDNIVKKIDLSSRKIFISAPDGLFDLYL